MILRFGLPGLLAALSFSPALTAQVQVLTYHNDGYRTGWNPLEKKLDTNTVKAASFGKLFELAVDDQVYAQPLYMSGLTVSGAVRHVLFVATTNNTLYAFDADNRAGNTPLWTVSLTPAGMRPTARTDVHANVCIARGGYHSFADKTALIATPVIDPASNTLYVEFAAAVDSLVDNHPEDGDETTYTSAGFHHYLAAVDAGTGTVKNRVEVTAQIAGSGSGSSGGVIQFDPRRQFERTGLVLANGYVYLAYSSHCDWNPYHGWVFGYDATTLAQKMVFNTTPADGRGAIWMCGSAPVLDGAGHLYMATGNGLGAASPSDPVNRGQSVIKLSPAPAQGKFDLASYFSPYDYQYLDDHDLDLLTSVVMVPGGNMLFAGGKDGKIHVMDSASLGGFDSLADHDLSVVHQPAAAAGMHCNYAYWKNGAGDYLLMASENAPVQSFPIDHTGKTLGSPATNDNTLISGYSGGYVAVSSNDTLSASGILWVYSAVPDCDAANSSCPGLLRALSAANLSSELWSSANAASDDPGNFSKMSSVTIANGLVYVPTISKKIVVYGLTKAAFDSTQQFTATNEQNQYALLQWNSNDPAASYFVVQHSTDGVNFTSLDSVTANGAPAYQQRDDQPAAGLNYYRLIEVYATGTIAQADRTLFFNGKTEPAVHPNPATDHVDVVRGAEDILDLRLFDLGGREFIREQNASAQADITLPLANLPRGMYVLAVRTASQTYRYKLLKR